MGDDGWRLQPKLLSERVQTALIEQLAELAISQERGFSIVLHGGEPLLFGARRLTRLFREVREALPSSCGLHIQTNGLLLTDTIIETCADYGVGISISLDGPAEVHDEFRIDRRGLPSHDRVVAAVRRLQQHPRGQELLSGVLAVVNPHSNPGVVYRYLKAIGAPSIDFLYRDGNHSKLPFGKRDFHSTEYGDWMCEVLRCYLADSTPPRIRILDDMLKLILGGAGAKEGVGLTDFGILVIDTDGSVNKNDTLKSAFAYADRFEQVQSIFSIRLAHLVQMPHFATYHSTQRPACSTCTSCPELAVCGGGMPSHRWSDQRGFDNPSVFCEDQKTLISQMRQRLLMHRAVA